MCWEYLGEIWKLEKLDLGWVVAGNSGDLGGSVLAEGTREEGMMAVAD